MKQKAFSLLSSLFLTVLSSCSGWYQEPLSFKLLVPDAENFLPFSSYYDQFGTHVFLKDYKEAGEAFFSDEYDAIVYDVTDGLDLIEKKHAHYRLARIQTWGNLYLLGKEGKDGSDLFSSSVYAFRNLPEGKDLTFELMEYTYGEELSYRKIYASSKELYQAVSGGGIPDADYLFLSEPYVSELLSSDSSYSYIRPFSKDFLQASTVHELSESGYSHYPSSGLFVSSKWDGDGRSDREKHENFFALYDNMQVDLQRNNGTNAVTFLSNAERGSFYTAADLFGLSVPEMEKLLSGGGKSGEVNPFGYVSYATDLTSFYASLSYAGMSHAFSKAALSSYAELIS